MLSERGNRAVAPCVLSGVLFLAALSKSRHYCCWFVQLTPVASQSECFSKLTAKEINPRHENMHSPPAPYVNYDEVCGYSKWFYIYCMLQIFALACSSDQILFCKTLKCSGKMPTEQIVKLSLSIRLATNFLQYLLDFSDFFYAMKLYLALP